MLMMSYWLHVTSCDMLDCFLVENKILLCNFFKVIGGNPERKIRPSNAEQLDNKQRFRLPETIIWQSKTINPRSSTVTFAVENAGFLIRRSPFVDSCPFATVVPLV